MWLLKKRSNEKIILLGMMFSVWLKRELWKEISEEEICADRFELVILIWNYDFKNVHFYSLKESTKSKPSIYRFISKCHSSLEETRASWKNVCFYVRAGELPESREALRKQWGLIKRGKHFLHLWHLNIKNNNIYNTKIYLKRDVCICITSKRRDTNKTK